MALGGKRPGSGRKPGFKFPRTIAKELARQRLRERVCAQLDPMIDAQIAASLGVKYLVIRNAKTGKFVRVTEAIAKGLDPGDERIEVWESEPSTAAFKTLTDQALDKPKEQEQEFTGVLNMVIRWADEK